MDKESRNQPQKTGQKKQGQKIARLVDENQELEKKYKMVSSELGLLKNRMQNLNHDLRNPLGGIRGMLDLMIIGQGEVQTRDLIMINEAAQSIINLLNDTLTAEGTEASLKEDLNTGRKLSSAMFEVNRLYLPMAQKKGIALSLSTEIEEELPLTPSFFKNLVQITGNLVANAIKFTPSSGSVDVVFTLDAEEDGRMLNMTVADTGKSMSPDQVTSFNQGKKIPRSKGTNGELGSGIGLVHVMKIVSEAGGRIDMESEAGSGTVFSLSFPQPCQNLSRKGIDQFIGKNSTSQNGHKS